MNHALITMGLTVATSLCLIPVVLSQRCKWSKWGPLVVIYNGYKAIQARKCLTCGRIQTRLVKIEQGSVEAINQSTPDE